MKDIDPILSHAKILNTVDITNQDDSGRLLPFLVASYAKCPNKRKWGQRIITIALAGHSRQN
jgi:hypothetical protein